MDLAELLQNQAVRDAIGIVICVASGATVMQIVNVAKAESQIMREEDEDE